MLVEELPACVPCQCFMYGSGNVLLLVKAGVEDMMPMSSKRGQII